MTDHPPTQTTPADRWVVAFALVYPTALTYLYFTLLAAAPPAVQNLSSAGLKCIQFGFPLYWVYRVQGKGVRNLLPERPDGCFAQKVPDPFSLGHIWRCWRRRLSPYRYFRVQRRLLRLRPSGSAGIVWGILFGAAVAAAMWLLYRYLLLPRGLMDQAAVAIRQKIVGFGVDTLPAYAALAVFYSLIHSFLEEYYWRWFVFAQLRRLTTVATAVTISSLGFAAHHVLLLGTFFGFDSPLTWLLSAAVAVGGAVWAWLYQTSRSLAAVWLSHLMVDAGIFLLGYEMFRGDLW